MKRTTPHQRRRPQQARSRDTLDAILDATTRILRRQGLGALTTNRISEVAGIAVATLYGYFPNKTAVMVALARRLMAEDEAAVAAAMAMSPEGDPIRTVVRTVLDRHRQDAAVRRAVMSVHHGQGLASEHNQTAERAIAALLAQDGPLRAHQPAVQARLFVLTRAVLGVARAMTEEGRGSDEDFAVEDELVRLAHLCLRGTA